MASTACTNFEYKFYNGGWGIWKTSLSGGYAGNSNRVAVLRFKTPSISGLFTGTGLSITIPYVRQTQPTSGTLYVKLYTSDPTTSSSICAIPTSSTCDASYAWKDISDRDVHKATFTFTRALEENTIYYLVIGNSGNYMEIGYNSTYDSWYSISLTYTSYTNGSKPTVSITDNGNNTFTISGTLGKSGTNNPLAASTLYFTTNGSKPDTSLSSSSGSTTVYDLGKTSGGTFVKGTFNVPNTSGTSTVKAVVGCAFSYGSPSKITSASAEKAVKYYAAPSKPGKPKLADSSFKNNRLTVKQDWSWEWTAATAANDSSLVKGYRIRFYKNGAQNCIINYYNGNSVSSELTSRDWIYDRGSGDPMPMRAIDQEVVPGDTVKLSVQAYTTNGAGTKLLSGLVASETYTVQNAGVVNVKIDNIWREGQVWIKTGNIWHEAETVNVKIDSNWRESQ